MYNIRLTVTANTNYDNLDNELNDLKQDESSMNIWKTKFIVCKYLASLTLPNQV